MACLGLAPHDDDGAAATKKPAKQVQPEEPEGYAEWKTSMAMKASDFRRSLAELPSPYQVQCEMA